MYEVEEKYHLPEGWKATKESAKGQNRYSQYSGSDALQMNHPD